jgi:hypothetical protein
VGISGSDSYPRNFFHCLRKPEHSGDDLPPAVDERLRSLEEHLKLYPQLRAAPKDVYARLKKLEDRVLALERRGIYPPRTAAGRGAGAPGGDEFDDDDWMPRPGSARPGGSRAPRAHNDSAPKTAPALPPLLPAPISEEKDDIEAKMALLRERLAQQAPQKVGEQPDSSDVAGTSSTAYHNDANHTDSHQIDQMQMDTGQSKDSEVLLLDAFGT